MFRRCISLFVAMVVWAFCANAQEGIVHWSSRQLAQIHDREHWIDSVYRKLTPSERIAQFFMVAAYSNKDSVHEKEIEKLVKEYKVGGIIFMQGNPDKEAILTNRYQSLAKVKLLISIDGEWGLQMRLKDSTIAFPKQLTLGAIKNDSLIYEMGHEIANQCKRLGIHIDFAPVIDVNSNPNNPVIGDRSFGEDKYKVAAKGLMYMKGLQENGVMACAKHFPGHGDAGTDSHVTLPLIDHSRAQLDSLEFYPFRVLFENKIQSVMAAHLSVPALDNTKNVATSLSHKVTTELLKNEMGFDGLVFSDALNMKGVSEFFQPGEVAVKAYEAGNDVLLFAGDVPKSMELFKQALKKGEIDSADMALRLKKLLAAKYDAGLAHYTPINQENLYEDLNNPQAKLLRRQLYEQAITLVANNNDFLPIKILDTLSFASVSIGSDSLTDFQNMLSNYAAFDHYDLKKNADSIQFERVLAKLSRYKMVIVGLHDMLKSSLKGYGISSSARTFLKELSAKTKVVLVVFGTPYSLKYFDGLDQVIEAYEDNIDTREAAAEAIFGAIPMTGTLPVTASAKWKVGTGIVTSALGRLKYTLPEEVGIRSQDLTAIDSIADRAIRDSATPGCQVLVAKDGKVIYYRSFGYQQYDSTLAIRNNDLYDLASVTKIAATTPALMYLYDHNIFSLNKDVCEYIPGIDTTMVGNANMTDILTHRAGLRPFFMFYKHTIADSVYSVCYKNEQDSTYCIEVRKDLFLRKDYADTIFNLIYHDATNTSKGYVYSDLGFYILKQIVESLSRDSFPHFLDKNFYRPLGMATMGFNPLRRFPLERIPPTENDTVFRKTLVHGYVHDPGAAMLGGVSGHAGLFSDANDLAILMQMLLNKGNYAGRKYLDSSTVALFTSRYSDKDRRALGFDKPETETGRVSPAGEKTSPQAFGHQGFTGTCVWADPQYNLTFVFLSNRVYPNAENKKLSSMGIRTKMQDAVYDALLKGKGVSSK